MISNDERRRAANLLRKASTGMYHRFLPLDVIAGSVGVDTSGKYNYDIENETYATLADFIDRPTGRNLVKHKEDPLVPGKQMVNGFFKCPNCGWDGSIWENVGFGDMLAYEAEYCPKCGLELEK